MELSQEQRNAVFTESKSALCLAGAGSGKTRVLVSRVQNLVDNCKVSPYEVLLCTFTRKAAGEMRERLEKLIGNKAYNVTIGTLHSVALNHIQRFGEFIGLNPGKITVYSSWEESVLLKDVCVELGYHTGKTWKGIKKKEIEAAFYLFYTRKERNKNHYKANEIMDAFFLRCRENNALTYGMIMTSFIDLIPRIGRMLKYKHIMIDETQDNDTCHPPGTLIKTYRGRNTGRGGKSIIENVPIEKLKNGDKVVSWDRKHGIVRPTGKKISIGKRYFSGDLLKIKCGDKSVSVTPDHKFYALMNGTGEDRYAVYLMWREGYGFRVGQCAIRYCRNTKRKPLSGIGSRFTEEKCDKGWIIAIVRKKQQALIIEQVISCMYRIPMIVFQPSIHTTYETIREIFSRVSDDGFKCLEDHGKSFSHPLYERKSVKGKKAPSKRFFEVHAMNLIPELMSIPIQKDSGIKTTTIKIDSISKQPYSGYVYSMDVEDDHTYIADGLIVKNCQWRIVRFLCAVCDASLFAVGDDSQSIYSFRGADPDYLIRNQEKFDIYKLCDNYRSDGNIVETANKLIKNNQNRLDLKMLAKRGYGECVKHFENVDSSSIVSHINARSEDFALPDSVAILARNHYLLEKLSKLLESAGIDHDYIGKKTAFTRSEEFRRVHALLNLAVNPFDNFSFMICLEYFGIDRELYKEIRMKAVKNDKSHFQVWREFDHLDWVIEYISAIDKESFDDVFEWMYGVDFGSDSVPVFEFVEDYISSHHEPTIKEYLEWLALFDVQDEITSESKKLQLMTIHASKGLEFDMVIIAGLNEGILPSYRAGNNLAEMESERRLAYVAYTRARDFLILTSRPVDPEAIIQQGPSRFIKESI